MNDAEPLTAAVFHILLALAGDDRHGYAIQQIVARDTNGQVRMGPGTLYGTLKRLLAAGLVAEAGERDDAGERRRYYRLTDTGHAAAQAEAARLLAAVQIARLRQLLPTAIPDGGGA